MRAMTRDVTPFELEGMVSTVTVLRLTTTDLNALRRALQTKLEQLPGFFQDAPVVVDLSALEGTDDEAESEGRERHEVSLDQLAAILRELKVVPIGVRNLRESRRVAARAAGLAVIRGGKRTTKVREVGAEPASSSERQRESTRSREPEAERPERDSFPPGSLVLRTPLRSGQVVYAEQCDAIILAPINAGAEIIADGNIHVYASLRGRALAGAHGNEEARIYCKSLEADLVAIAGCYLRADEIPEKSRGKPAQIYLENGNLVVAEL
jgi:septum site-determining protein MinC